MSAGGTIDADSRDHRSRLQLLRSALAEELCDIEVYKIGVRRNIGLWPVRPAEMFSAVL